MLIPQVLDLLLGLSIVKSLPRFHDVHKESLVCYGIGFLYFYVGEGKLSTNETKKRGELELQLNEGGEKGNERGTELETRVL